MTYVYTSEGGGFSEVEEARIPDAVAGACPPQVIEYRIYPQVNFNEIFGDPPDSIDL